MTRRERLNGRHALHVVRREVAVHEERLAACRKAAEERAWNRKRTALQVNGKTCINRKRRNVGNVRRTRHVEAGGQQPVPLGRDAGGTDGGKFIRGADQHGNLGGRRRQPARRRHVASVGAVELPRAAHETRRRRIRRIDRQHHGSVARRVGGEERERLRRAVARRRVLDRELRRVDHGPCRERDKRQMVLAEVRRRGIERELRLERRGDGRGSAAESLVRRKPVVVHDERRELRAERPDRTAERAVDVELRVAVRNRRHRHFAEEVRRAVDVQHLSAAVSSVRSHRDFRRRVAMYF